MSDYNYLKQAHEREQHARELRKAHEEIDMLKREITILASGLRTIAKCRTLSAVNEIAESTLKRAGLGEAD